MNDEVDENKGMGGGAAFSELGKRGSSSIWMITSGPRVIANVHG